MAEGITKKILLVVNEPEEAERDKAVLIRNGFSVREAGSLASGLEAVGSDSGIDLIIVGISPGNYLEIVDAAEQMLQTRSLPLLFVSSADDPQMIKETERVDSFGFIVRCAGDAAFTGSVNTALSLFESRKIYSDAFDYSINGLCVHKMLYDSDGNPADCLYLKANRSYEGHTGLSSDFVTGKTIRDIYPAGEADEVISLYAEVVKSGKTAQRELYFEPTRRWYDLNIFPMKGDEFTVVLQNITERKRAEAESNLNNLRLESLLRINSHPSENIQDLLDFALHEAIDLTRSRIGYIYFYSEEKREFTLNTWSKEVLPLCTVMDQQTVYQLEKTGIWGEAVRQRKAVIINDFAAPNELKKGLPEGHVSLKSFLTIPVFSGHEIVAVAGVANKDGDYDESDVRQLTLMMDAVWKNVLRRRIEEQLIETKNELEGYFSSSLDLLCIATTSGEFVRLNPQWEKALGYKIKDLEGKSFLDLVHPDDLEATLASLSTLDAQEEILNFENRYRRSDGAYRWIEWRSRPVGDTIYAAARDITKRKTTEEKIRSLLGEKELLLKETHHRIKNNLNTVYSLLSMQAGAAENTDSRDIIDDAANRVKGMALLYDRLYRTGDFAEMSIRDFLPPLVDEIIGLFKPAHSVETLLKLDDINLGSKILSPLGIIINELITNSMKYAFGGMDEGLIEISAGKSGPVVTVVYRDNGSGLPEGVSFDSPSGFGMQLVYLLVQQLEGSIEIDRSGGAGFIISFEP